MFLSTFDVYLFFKETQMQKSVMTVRIVLFGLFAMLCSVFISVAQAETPNTANRSNSQ